MSTRPVTLVFFGYTHCPDIGNVGGAYEAERGAYVTGFVDGRARVVWSETTSVRAHRADLRRLQSNTT